MCALQSRYLQLLAHTHTPADTHHLLPGQTRRLRGFSVRGTIPSLMKLHAYSHPGTNTFAYKILPPQAPNLDPLLCVCRCLEAKMTPSLRVSREFHPKSWQHLLPFPLRAVLIAFPGVPLPLADEEEACQVCWCGGKKVEVSTAAWICISNQLIRTSKTQEGKSTPAAWRVGGRADKNYVLMRIPWTLVPESVWLTMRVVSIWLEFHPTLVAEIRVSPSFLPSLPLFSVIADLCPSPPLVCRHGNHSSLPTSLLFFPPSHPFFFHPLLFTFLVILRCL